MKKSIMSACVAVLAFCVGIAPAAEAQSPKKYTETITTKDGSKLSLDMVLIPGGAFTMGSPAGEADRVEHEGPQRQVQVNPFYLCTTETTIELFLAYYQETGTAKKDFLDTEAAQKEEEAKAGVNAITGPTPVYGDMTMGYSKKHPAIGGTWHNAMTFCRWLSQKTGKPYRLPTEAEWEYSAKCGSSSPFGACESQDGLKDYAWFDATANMEPHAVGTKKPNAWGLYDMHGNVREWVQDLYSPAAYGQSIKDCPAGPKEGKVHVARGGFYDSPAGELRCAARAFEEDWWRMNDPQIPKSKWWLPQIDSVGFRVACTMEPDKQK